MKGYTWAETRRLVTVIYLALCIYQCTCSSEIQITTYRHELDNGEMVTCSKCKPGTYLIDDCSTDGGRAKCGPCGVGTFNPYYTEAPVCANCSKTCQTPDREYIAKNCTQVSNISCLCRESYYRASGPFGLCLKINACPPGKGVLKEGNGLADTVCEDCPAGYFSAINSKTERCLNCSKCLNGQVQVQDCRPDADRICKPPEADAFPVEAVIGIVLGVILVVTMVILVCCLCVMKERCAPVRAQLCICCNRPYEECHQLEKTAMNGTTFTDISETRPNGTSVPDVVRNTPDKPHAVPNDVFHILREDLISQEYPQFFRLLFEGDADKHIDEMKMNYSNHGVKEIIYQILLRWRDIEKEHAKPEKILDALTEWKGTELAQKYSDIFGQNSTQLDNSNRHRNHSRSSVSTEV